MPMEISDMDASENGRRTTVAISAGTRDRLRALGKKGETYDQLVNRLIEELEGARERLAEIVEFEPVRDRRP